MPTPKQIPTPPQLLVQDSGRMAAVSPQMGSMSSLSPSVPSTPLHQECSPGLAAATSPVPMNANTSFAPSPQSRSPIEKPLNVMDILNEASKHAAGPSTSSISPQVEQGIANILNWLPQPVSAPVATYGEQNLDNWLGQLFTDDNLVVGASLPPKIG